MLVFYPVELVPRVSPDMVVGGFLQGTVLNHPEMGPVGISKCRVISPKHLLECLHMEEATLSPLSGQ